MGVTSFGHDLPTPTKMLGHFSGALAQLGERLICIQEVRSSILLGSTIPRFACHGEAEGFCWLNLQEDCAWLRQFLPYRLDQQALV